MRAIEFDEEVAGEVDLPPLDRTTLRRVPTEESESEFQRKMRDGMDSLLKRFMG